MSIKFFVDFKFKNSKLKTFRLSMLNVDYVKIFSKKLENKNRSGLFNAEVMKLIVKMHLKNI